MRRRASVVERLRADLQMPDELRHHPWREQDITHWLGDDVMPNHWTRSAADWRRIHAQANWRRARQAWYATHNPLDHEYRRRQGQDPSRRQ